MALPRLLDGGTVDALAALLAALAPLAYVALYLGSLLLFLSPGILAAVPLVRRGIFPPACLLILAVTAGCCLGYATFGAYFVGPRLGRVASAAVIGAGVAAGARAWLGRKRWAAVLESDDVRRPLGLMAVVGLFYLCVTYAVALGYSAENQPRARFLDRYLPHDNLIPLSLAEALYNGYGARGAGGGGWQSSDRPPLQAGIFLTQRPLAAPPAFAPGLHYEVLACALQCSWIPALWALLRGLGLSPVRVHTALGLLTFSGFLMVNSVFAWPKLLAGALAVFAVTLVLGGVGAGTSPVRVAAVGGAGGLAVLAHGGAAFTLIALAGMLLLPRYYPGIGRLALGAAAFAALLAPWLAYQRGYDPPGDRLVKVHIAGAARLDDRGTWRVLADSYREAGLARTVRNKWENLRVLFAENPAAVYGDLPGGGWATRFAGLRRREFHNLFFALGVLNVGWLPLWRWLRHRRPNVPAPRPGGSVGPVMLFGAWNVGLWVLLMFGPGTTVVHQGPYAAFLLLFGVLAVGVAMLPPRALGCAALLQVGWFAFVWLATPPAGTSGRPDFAMMLAAGILFLVIVRDWLRAARALSPPCSG